MESPVAVSAMVVSASQTARKRTRSISELSEIVAEGGGDTLSESGAPAHNEDENTPRNTNKALADPATSPNEPQPLPDIADTVASPPYRVPTPSPYLTKRRSLSFSRHSRSNHPTRGQKRESPQR